MVGWANRDLATRRAAKKMEESSGSPEWTPEACKLAWMAGWVSRSRETQRKARKMVEYRIPESSEAHRWGKSPEWTPGACKLASMAGWASRFPETQSAVRER